MRAILSLMLLVAFVSTLSAQSTRPVVLDTDIGNDPGDAFALALLMASPEIDLRGVSIVGTEPDKRAMLACRFLTMTGRRHVAVATGEKPAVERKMAGMYQYYYHPDPLFNRTTKPVNDKAADFLNSRVQAQPERVSIVAVGPLTNIAKLLEENGKAKTTLRRIIVAGENIRRDIKAAQSVIASGAPLVVIPPELTAKLVLSATNRKRLFSPETTLSQQTEALFQLTDESDPNLAEVLAAALCLDEGFCEYETRHIVIDDKGAMQTGNLRANVKVATKVHAEKFIEWYVRRMESCVTPSSRPVRACERGMFPHRVHVAEDYDSDIERRWWMAGKEETRNLPLGSKRACRAVLTHDFDDLLGHSRVMYKAVIFNPVPGPPMGKNTRLAFDLWTDTDTVRVQLYSLSNGYHRHLVLTGLEKRKWLSLTVDMTQMRRADGTGGPLSEGERIDDIQFYAHHRAELIADNLLLYDAATEGEKRPFPKKIHFTGGFDSGKQGKEWPGTFEIAFNRGAFWHAAKAVNDDEGVSIKMGLRGRRPLGEVTRLRFKYHLTGDDQIRVSLRDGKDGPSADAVVSGATKGKWTEATLELSSKGMTGSDEIRFRCGKGAELLVDDVLLFE